MLSVRYRGFNDALLSLRGIAAFSVLIFHSMMAFKVSGQQPDYAMHYLPHGIDAASLFRQIVVYLTNGHAAVTFFFVHSGFVLTLALSRSKIGSGMMDGTRFVLGYYVRRIFRLWPIVILVVVAMFLYQMGGFAPAVGVAFSDWYQAILADPITLKVLKHNILLQQTNINRFLWSLVIEGWGSVLMPAFFLLGRRTSTMAVMVITMLGAILLLNHVGMIHIGKWPMTALRLEFVACMAAGSVLAFSHDVIRQWPLPINRNWLVACAAILLIVARWNAPNISVSLIIESLASAVIIFIVYYFDEGPLQAFCNLRIVKFYGAISYSLYVISPLAIHVAGLLVRRWFGDSFLVEHGLVGVMVVVAIALLIGTSASWATYTWIEQPFMRFGRRLDRAVAGGRWREAAAVSA